MKKSLVIISFAFIFLLSLSIISAQENVQGEKISFGKWLKNLWGKITGTTITGMQITICTDSDNGKTYTTRGSCVGNNGGHQDSCSGSQIIEYFCDRGNCASETVGCGVGKTCSNGVCITGIQEVSEEVGSGIQVTGCIDSDGDGFFVLARGCASPYDCNDGNANIKPGAAETCGNNIDEDCSGADLVCGASTCVDADGDGYGTGNNLADCPGSTTIPDCNDNDGTNFPGNPEICDGKDNNCDTKIDSLDGGNNLLIADSEAGESCVNSGTVKEFWCNAQNQLISESKLCSQFVGANTFCDSGACTSCVDTDIPAVNFTSFGETYNLSRINNHAKDSCKSNTLLNESFCSGNNVAFQIKDCAQFGIAYSCKNGACSCTPSYVINTCNLDDTAVFQDASQCGLPDYTTRYDCNGDGVISGPSCSGMENEDVGIDGLEFEADKNYTKTTEKGISLVQLAEDNGAGVDFNWNFSIGAAPLNFCNIKVEVADSSDDFGYTIIKNVSAKNKTLWVERLNKTSGAVCIKDIPGEISISDFSDRCNGAGEILVPCSGTNKTYNCNIVYDTPPSKSSWFQVWPLNHSAVKEITFLASAGAGACAENWNCTNWTNLADECGTKNCVDLNNCGTNFTKPDEEISCIESPPLTGCFPDWDCSDFGKCADGIKERVCSDLNNCGDDSAKPSETSDCRKISPLIIALIVVGLILIIFLIWYFTRKKDEEDYSNETPVHTTHHSPPRSPPTNVYTPRPAHTR